jgi:glycosyltransferase involved in cell wall biosynthesis
MLADSDLGQDDAELVYANASGDRTSLYVVQSHDEKKANKRVLNILRVRNELSQLTLISPSGDAHTKDAIIVKPYRSPFGLFRRTGLPPVARWGERWFLFPSRWSLFAIPVIKRLKRAIADDLARGLQPALITCLPAHDLCLVGLACKKAYPSLRWIIDWQDLWSYDPNYFDRVPTPLKGRIRRLERRALSNADHHVTTNARAARVLVEHYGVQESDVTPILHPYDEDDIRAAALCAKPPQSTARSSLKIGFLGTLFKPPRVPGLEVVGALANVRRNGLPIELHVVGDTGRQRPDALPIEFQDFLHMHPRLPSAESLQLVSSCDVLLLVLADLLNSRVVLSIKLPQYLLLGRPIVAIVPEDSTVADIVRETQSGVVVAPGLGLDMRLLATLKAIASGSDKGYRSIAAPPWMAAEQLELKWSAVIKDAPRMNSSITNVSGVDRTKSLSSVSNAQASTTTLRVLMLTSDHFPPFRPAAKAIFTDEFARRGHRVDWLLQAEDMREPVGEIGWGLGVATVCATNDGQNRWSRFRKHLADILNDLKVVSRLKRDRYDLVQVKDKYLGALVALLVARIRRVPFLYWLAYPHGDAAIRSAETGIARYRWQRMAKGMVYRWLLYSVILPRADHIFVQSEQMRIDLTAEGIPRARMTPVPSSVDLDRIRQAELLPPMKKPPGELWITYLGTLIRLRKLDFLIRAFAIVRARHPSANLYLVGFGEDPSDEECLLEEARKQGVADAVVITGRLPMEEAWRYVRASDVCVSPYYPTAILKSTSPTKLVEYFALGRAAVCNDHPEQSQVAESSGGALCTRWVESEFADAIGKLLDDPIAARLMGTCGRRYVQEQRSSRQLADVVEDVYWKVIRDHASTSVFASAE